MPRLTLVRHGRAASGWGDDLDPGLDDVGRGQASAVAATLTARGPQPIVVSPLLRCRETAEPLEERWAVVAVVDPAVGEIPSPEGADLAERSAWLRQAMAGCWADVGDEWGPWRRGVIDALLALEVDTVVVSHFVAINVAVGAATGDDRVVCFAPDNCSTTILDSGPEGLQVVALGGAARTEVL